MKLRNGKAMARDVFGGENLSKYHIEKRVQKTTPEFCGKNKKIFKISKISTDFTNFVWSGEMSRKMKIFYINK